MSNYNELMMSEKIDLFHKDLIQLNDSRGITWLVSYVKTSRNCIMRCVSGEPLSDCPGVALSAGWPKWLIHLKDLSTDSEGLKALLTLLTLLRAISLKPVLDTSTITAPWSGNEEIQNHELKAALKCLGIPSGQVGKWSFPHMSTKKGPQGQAILTSLSELTLLPHELIKNITLLGGDKLGNMIKENLEPLDIIQAVNTWSQPDSAFSSVSRWWAYLFPTKSKSLRKISFFSDKEGKTRVIGIMDYWSQSALRPLHLFINKRLKRISMDCTFNQDHFTTYLPTWQLANNSYHSIDLSAATDRMPISLQKRVVEHLFRSTEMADAWENILVGYPFSISGQTTLITYGAGQPMGAYSSWPVMALTHHIIVQVAAMRCGLSCSRLRPQFKAYALLGDDLVIANDRVATAYKALIKSLDMPYSEAKTHTSKDAFEFAKRWFYQGTEITGFSIAGLFSVWKSYPLLSNFIATQSKHGWVLPHERHPDLILALTKVLAKKNFIFEKTSRAIALYQVFNQFSTIKSRTKTGYPELHIVMLKYFGFSPFEVPLLVTEAVDIIELIFTEAKRKLVEKDLYTFQSDAYKVNAKLNKFVKDRITEARVDQATGDFLKETLSVVLNWNHPMVLCLNNLIDRSTEFLLNYWDPSISSDFLFEAGLSKYKVSKGVFSLRASSSIILAESAILKEFLNVSKDYCNGRLIPILNDNGF